MNRRRLPLLVLVLTMTLAACGKTPAQLEEERFLSILYQSDRTLDRGPLILYLNQRYTPEADRLINQGMMRWAIAHRARWPELSVRLQAFRIDGINRAAE